MLQAADFTVLNLNNARFSTSADADEINKELMAALGVSVRYVPARMAIARSLAIRELPKPIPDTGRSDAPSIKGEILFGQDLPLWVALIVEHSGQNSLTLRHFHDLVRRHWRRGAHILISEWKASAENLESFLLNHPEFTRPDPS